MNRISCFLSTLCLLGSGLAAFAGVPEGYNLVFSDEFNGSSLDTSKWKKYDYVNWNNVPDWRKYNSRDDALYVFNGNSLSLKAAYGDYTSQADQAGKNDTYACAAITSQGKFSFQYGYVEVRARFDIANGMWPAIWLLSDNGATWPAGGEIDIMEHLNRDPDIHQTIHYNNSSGNRTSQTANPEYGALYGWHKFGMLWTEYCIKMYLDDKEIASFSSNSSNWPFDDEGNEFYLILSNQIGGEWVGNTMTPEGINNTYDANNELASTNGKNFSIDYVRVYQIPEPSSFGMLLGASVLALSALRRRRK